MHDDEEEGWWLGKSREGGDTLEDYIRDEEERDPFGYSETLNSR